MNWTIKCIVSIDRCQSEAVDRRPTLNNRFGESRSSDTPALAQYETIYKTVKFSSHAPITVDYDFKL